jgi:hypothetical protein
MKAGNAGNNLSIRSKCWIVLGILCAASISYSVHPQTNADPKKAAAGVPATNPPPQAVFKVPATLQEGLRDPFYPKSTYFIGRAPAPQQSTNVAPVVVHIEQLKLQGISGPPNHRLPIINGRTFEVGEEAEVSTTNGKVGVKCLEVKGDIVTVVVNGERQVLKLRQGL